MRKLEPLIAGFLLSEEQNWFLVLNKKLRHQLKNVLVE